MSTVTLCLVLLALAAGAPLLSRLTRLKLPFVQIGLGVLAALPPARVHLALDPHLFLLLFIPPLLFGDGWSLPRRELAALRWPVLGHAVGLVLLTVVVGGYGLHWLFPALPLSVAFAIAALVSPTDAVAFSAITERVAVPRRLRHLLESEALLNDASGLVAMRFAVAATLSGDFSPGWAAASFVLVAAGGLAIGGAMMLAYARLHRALLARAEDAAVQTVLSALLPFAAYGAAEAVGASGILAAVAAGLVANRVGLLEGAHFSARLQTRTMWEVVRFCLNGVVFVLLGLQLPGIIGSGPVGIDLIRSTERLPVIGGIAALTVLLVVLRLAWTLASALLARLAGRQDGRGGWRMVMVSGLAGVRGAVTLAGVLSLPLALGDGTPFPGRDLAVTLATGVILGSMLIAAVGLPLLLRGLRQDGTGLAEEGRAARIAALEAAIGALAGGADTRGAALAGTYRARLAALRHGAADATMREDDTWRALHEAALRAERMAVQGLRDDDRIDDTVARALLAELDLVEAAMMRQPFRLRPG